jgi:peptidoglycan hydrolase CwlO-like protein
MKKNFLILTILGVLTTIPSLFTVNVFAQSSPDEDTQIIDELNKKETENLQALEENIKFKQFSSCVDMEKVMKVLVDKF